jgi:hypothetical protein
MDFWDEKVKNHQWTIPDCCPPCRLRKRELRAEGKKPELNPPAVALIAANEEQHENDGADDDYMEDYCMSMSDTAMITEDRQYSEYMQCMQWKSD